jgi:integrase
MPGRTFKRGDIWWIAFSHKGKEYRHSAKTESRREAESVLVHYLGLCARNEFKGFEQKTATYSLFEMLDDFKDDYERRGMRSSDTVTYHSHPLKEYFGDISVTDITERAIDLYIKQRLKTISERTHKPVSRTTVNRETQVLGAAMRLAKRKKLITEMPYIEHFSEKGNARQGFFEREEFEKILEFLPDHLKDVARFAYCVGWRRGEILSLEWQYVQKDVIRLPPSHDKAKEGRIIPIMGELAEIIERRRQERRQECPYVFHYQGRRFRDFKSAWQTAREKAGMPNKLFHDHRRTVVRNLDRAGVPREVAKQIVGHKTDIMYNRYRIVNEQDMRDGMVRYLGQKTDTK